MQMGTFSAPYMPRLCQHEPLEWEQEIVNKEWLPTRWFRILSRITWIISKDDMDETE
jgi:hypothetical protein